MGSLFGNIVRGIGGAVAGAGRVTAPFLKSVPYVGTALTALDLASNVFGGLGGSNASGNTGIGGGLPALPGMPGSNPYAGKRTILGNDPNIAAALQGFAISKSHLRMFYRAPKGYVIRHDEKGDAYAIPKALARKYLGWKPAKKPLLSIRDTNAIHHAATAIKKFEKMEKTIKHIANWHAPRHKPADKNIIVTGKVVK